ncbi:hypothetical protein GCM10025864_01370 [Luteimicrobium album]|uniref:Uncharacterized protein n=1 Tax=Luteimicrobium album TaxID=1054550 RepID=A0ABQ6HV31_9MICO|nr:hypothetical protein [Luteimicrobium album]GMA22378.1 hypothetical protein GCM10025864_01370 [Luteimicrobium album]
MRPRQVDDGGVAGTALQAVALGHLAEVHVVQRGRVHRARAGLRPLTRLGRRRDRDDDGTDVVVGQEGAPGKAPECTDDLREVA